MDTRITPNNDYHLDSIYANCEDSLTEMDILYYLTHPALRKQEADFKRLRYAYIQIAYTCTSFKEGVDDFGNTIYKYGWLVNNNYTPSVPMTKPVANYDEPSSYYFHDTACAKFLAIAEFYSAAWIGNLYKKGNNLVGCNLVYTTRPFHDNKKSIYPLWQSLTDKNASCCQPDSNGSTEGGMILYTSPITDIRPELMRYPTVAKLYKMWQAEHPKGGRVPGRALRKAASIAAFRLRKSIFSKLCPCHTCTDTTDGRQVAINNCIPCICRPSVDEMCDRDGIQDEHILIPGAKEKEPDDNNKCKPPELETYLNQDLVECVKCTPKDIKNKDGKTIEVFCPDGEICKDIEFKKYTINEKCGYTKPLLDVFHPSCITVKDMKKLVQEVNKLTLEAKKYTGVYMTKSPIGTMVWNVPIKARHRVKASYLRAGGGTINIDYEEKRVTKEIKLKELEIVCPEPIETKKWITISWLRTWDPLVIGKKRIYISEFNPPKFCDESLEEKWVVDNPKICLCDQGGLCMPGKVMYANLVKISVAIEKVTQSMGIPFKLKFYDPDKNKDLKDPDTNKSLGDCRTEFPIICPCITPPLESYDKKHKAYKDISIFKCRHKPRLMESIQGIKYRKVTMSTGKITKVTEVVHSLEDVVEGWYEPGTILDIEAPGTSSDGDFSTWSCYDDNNKYVTDVIRDLGNNITKLKVPDTNIKVYASYAHTKVYLTVENGSGSGYYYVNSHPTIVANEPPKGYKWLGWTVVYGDVTIAAPGLVITHANTGHRASKVKANYKLIINPPDDYEVTTIKCSGAGIYSEGDPVTVEAEVPETGYKYLGMTSDDAGPTVNTTDRKFTFNMPDHDLTVVASYAKQYYIHVIDEYWDPAGSATPNPARAGATVTIGYTSVPGFIELSSIVLDAAYIGWSETLTPPDNDFEMPADDVYAYVYYKYNLTVTGGTPANSLNTPSTTVIISAPPQDSEGKDFDKWEVSSSSMTTPTFEDDTNYNTTLTTDSEAGTAIVKATYKEDITYYVIVHKGDVIGGSHYTADEIVYIEPDEPEEGETFAGWEVNSGGPLTISKDETTGYYTFTMPSKNVTVTATYEDNHNPNTDIDLVHSNVTGASWFTDNIQGKPGDTSNITAWIMRGVIFDSWEMTYTSSGLPVEHPLDIMDDNTVNPVNINIPGYNITITALYTCDNTLILAALNERRSWVDTEVPGQSGNWPQLTSMPLNLQDSINSIAEFFALTTPLQSGEMDVLILNTEDNRIAALLDLGDGSTDGMYYRSNSAGQPMYLENNDDCTEYIQLLDLMINLIPRELVYKRKTYDEATSWSCGSLDFDCAKARYSEAATQVTNQAVSDTYTIVWYTEYDQPTSPVTTDPYPISRGTCDIAKWTYEDDPPDYPSGGRADLWTLCDDLADSGPISGWDIIIAVRKTLTEEDNANETQTYSYRVDPPVTYNNQLVSVDDITSFSYIPPKSDVLVGETNNFPKLIYKEKITSYGNPKLTVEPAREAISTMAPSPQDEDDQKQEVLNLDNCVYTYPTDACWLEASADNQAKSQSLDNNEGSTAQDLAFYKSGWMMMGQITISDFIEKYFGYSWSPVPSCCNGSDCLSKWHFELLWKVVNALLYGNFSQDMGYKSGKRVAYLLNKCMKQECPVFYAPLWLETAKCKFLTAPLAATVNNKPVSEPIAVVTNYIEDSVFTQANIEGSLLIPSKRIWFRDTPHCYNKVYSSINTPDKNDDKIFKNPIKLTNDYTYALSTNIINNTKLLIHSKLIILNDFFKRYNKWNIELISDINILLNNSKSNYIIDSILLSLVIDNIYTKDKLIDILDLLDYQPTRHFYKLILLQNKLRQKAILENTNIATTIKIPKYKYANKPIPKITSTNVLTLDDIYSIKTILYKIDDTLKYIIDELNTDIAVGCSSCRLNRLKRELYETFQNLLLNGDKTIKSKLREIIKQALPGKDRIRVMQNYKAIEIMLYKSKES